MGKRIVALLACMVMVAAAAACGVGPAGTAIPSASASVSPIVSASPVTTTAAPTSTASPTAALVSTEEQETPEPEPTEYPEIPEYPDFDDEPDPTSVYDIPGMKETGITNEQYSRIELLLDGIMGMYPHLFHDVSQISHEQLYGFLIEELMVVESEIGWYSIDNDGNALIDKAIVDKVIFSAFGKPLKAEFTGKEYNSLTYKNGIYTYAGVQGTLMTPHDLRISRLSANRIQIDMNVIGEYDPGWIFYGKARAILEEDKSSIYRYHMVSMTELKPPSFPRASASSWLPAKGKVTYKPGNCIDKKDNTGWCTDKGKGQWLKLSSPNSQTISGIMFTLKDTLNGPADITDTVIKLDFSDGTSLSWTLSSVPDDYWTDTLCFGKEIKTNYIKITIVSTEEKKIFISEIEPY